MDGQTCPENSNNAGVGRSIKVAFELGLNIVSRVYSTSNPALLSQDKS